MIPPKKKKRKEKSHFCHWQVLKQIFQLLNSPSPGEVNCWSGDAGDYLEICEILVAKQKKHSNIRL